MMKGSGRRFSLGLAFACLGAFLTSGPASGQILAIGGHIVTNADVQEEFTWGVGARAQLGLPLTGLTIQGTYDFFGPECETQECDLADAGVNLLWALPVPFLLKPYLGAGLAFQKWDGESFSPDDDSDTGFNFLGGVILQGPTFSRFQPFVEFKYQAWNDYDDQKVISGGILLVLF